ncbi:MAG TPA: flippase-like domain-containing protein [Thermoflexia bacterium]|nr:flippase-like domain-containing protein [Thermoflexia bacterium]
MKKHAFNILKIVVSAGLLVYLLVFQIDVKELWSVARQARWGYLIAAMILMIAGTALRAVRWQVLLQALDIHVPLRRLVQLYFIGAFFNIFLPTGLGGDAVKMAELSRTLSPSSTGGAPEAVGTTLVDRATGLWVLFVLALVALPFSHTLLPDGWAPVIALGTLGGVVGGWVVMGTPLIPWLGSKVRLPGQEKAEQVPLERFYRSVSQLGYKALGKACAVSLVFDVLLIIFNVLVARGLDVDQPLGVFLLFTPVISFSLALPISIGGLGVREQTYVLLFGALGVSSAVSAAMSLANYTLTNLVIGLLGGIVYALEGTRGLIESGQDHGTSI